MAALSFPCFVVALFVGEDSGTIALWPLNIRGHRYTVARSSIGLDRQSRKVTASAIAERPLRVDLSGLDPIAAGW